MAGRRGKKAVTNQHAFDDRQMSVTLSKSGEDEWSWSRRLLAEYLPSAGLSTGLSLGTDLQALSS